MNTITIAAQDSNTTIAAYGERKVTLDTKAFKLLMTLNKPTLSAEVQKMLMTKCGMTKGQVIALLERVSVGYKGFKGVPLLQPVVVEDRRYLMKWNDSFVDILDQPLKKIVLKPRNQKPKEEAVVVAG
jgi:hypothetical protein